jgi:uncharacterized membrane protein YidH (DUF202 family)
MDSKKLALLNKAKNYKRKTLQDKEEKPDFQTKLKEIGKKLGQLEKREFWYAHLPFPKFLRKPRIRFSLPRVNTTVPIPNRIIMFAFSLILVGFSIAGGAYDMVSTNVGKIAVGYDTSTTPATPIFFYNGLNDQFMLEGIIAFAIIMMGFIGFMFIHQSTKHFYRPKYSYMLFAIGIVLVLFAVFSLQSIVINQKGVNLYSPNF